MANAEIVAIGSELLLGQIVDTNSAWLSQQLAAVGCDVAAHLTVPDNQPAIEQAIEEVMAKNPGQLADYRSGKDKLFGFFVGQVMKATQGKANPAQVNELLKKKLAGP